MSRPSSCAETSLLAPPMEMVNTKWDDLFELKRKRISSLTFYKLCILTLILKLYREWSNSCSQPKVKSKFRSWKWPHTLNSISTYHTRMQLMKSRMTIILQNSNHFLSSWGCQLGPALSSALTSSPLFLCWLHKCLCPSQKTWNLSLERLVALACRT